MNNSTLLSQLKKGPFNFKNRVFMAPMTRSRAPEQIPTEPMIEYYAQRSSAGLIFTEGAQVSPQGVGYIFTPGIHSKEQINGWKKITTAVHQNNGLIFCQLWHVGRVSHPDFHNGNLPVAPSAISFEGQAYTIHGPKDVVIPHALSLEEIKSIINDFKNAAIAAKEARFDGVEIHGANGYLPAQFLEDGANQRTDLYGGTIENRSRFILELTDAAISVWGPERVSVRLSPRNPYNGMSESQPESTYLFLIEQLEKRKLGILHFMEPAELHKEVTPLAPEVRKIFSGLLILNSGYNQKNANSILTNGGADAVSFGSLFIANPDLPERFENNATMSLPDRSTMYGGGIKGYTDYPKMGH